MDTVTPGQWFHGRIYEHRCDLSPDGALLLYFASKLNRYTLRDREYTYAWTAISRPPWLTALALWPKGDCWHGGGLFLDATSVWLNHRPEVAIPHPSHRPSELRIVPNPEARGEDEPVLFRRLERDGWRMTAVGEARAGRDGWEAIRPWVWEKPRRDRRYLLVMRYEGYSVRRYGPNRIFTYAVRTAATGVDEPIVGANWADWDQRGRLVATRAGQLWAGEPADLHLVADLNDQRPEPMPTPDWAVHW